MAREGFISRHKSLLIQEITNKIGKIHPKIHPSRIDWCLLLICEGDDAELSRESNR